MICTNGSWAPGLAYVCTLTLECKCTFQTNPAPRSHNTELGECVELLHINATCRDLGPDRIGPPSNLIPGFQWVASSPGLWGPKPTVPLILVHALIRDPHVEFQHWVVCCVADCGLKIGPNIGPWSGNMRGQAGVLGYRGCLSTPEVRRSLRTIDKQA